MTVYNVKGHKFINVLRLGEEDTDIQKFVHIYGRHQEHRIILTVEIELISEQEYLLES